MINTRIRIIVADDHRLVREGLRALLEQLPEVTVVAEAGDGRSTVRLAGELKPNLIVMDLAMPDLNGIEATRQIVAENPEIKVVAVSGQADPRSVRLMLEAGASGFVSKESAFRELTSAIRTVLANKVFISPSVSHQIVEENRVADLLTVTPSVLSPRERETLQLIAEGKQMKEIAKALDLSVKTVETHRRNIMEKLNVDSVAGLTKYAIREGITSVN